MSDTRFRVNPHSVVGHWPVWPDKWLIVHLLTKLFWVQIQLGSYLNKITGSC